MEGGGWAAGACCEVVWRGCEAQGVGRMVGACIEADRIGADVAAATAGVAHLRRPALRLGQLVPAQLREDARQDDHQLTVVALQEGRRSRRAGREGRQANARSVSAKLVVSGAGQVDRSRAGPWCRSACGPAGSTPKASNGSSNVPRTCTQGWLCRWEM